MNGRAEVARLKQRLDATFQRIDGVGSDLELRSDFARYLCVLVSGYLEKAVAELVLEHARRSGGPSLQRFVEMKTRLLRTLTPRGCRIFWAVLIRIGGSHLSLSLSTISRMRWIVLSIFEIQLHTVVLSVLPTSASMTITYGYKESLNGLLTFVHRSSRRAE